MRSSAKETVCAATMGRGLLAAKLEKPAEATVGFVLDRPGCDACAHPKIATAAAPYVALRGTFGIEKRERMLQPDLVSHLVVVRSSLSLPNERLQSPSRYNIEFKSTALQLRLRKLACHGDREGEKCSSCSLCARVKRENRAHSAQYSFARASIGTVDAFGVRLLVSFAVFKVANRSE